MLIIDGKTLRTLSVLFCSLFFSFFVPVASIVDSPIYDRFFYTIRFGYHDNHPDYESDLPRADQYREKIPFGLPAGFFSARGKGPPVGLLAYVVRLGSINSMWKEYYADNEAYLTPIYRGYFKLRR